MDASIVNALGTIGFGGGGIAIVAYLSFLYGKEQLKTHKESMERVCESFDRALDRRDKDIELLVNEIKANQSGILYSNS